jgi:acyl-coenzyme A thioesterase PaaI-like protein
VSESVRTRLFRWMMNVYPAYAGSGGRVTFIAADWREVRVELALGWRTRNYVGTLFGGSLYACVDPFYMLMLIKNLGPRYVVWDKAATIRFKRPGRGKLHAVMRVGEGELDAIRGALSTHAAIERHYRIELSDAAGVVHALVEKTVHIRRRDAARPARARPEI